MRRRIRTGGPEWREVRVGLALMVALVLLAYGIYRVGELFQVFAKRYELVTFVPNAPGLMQGAPVTLAGQRVGQVDEIEFIPMREKPGSHNLQIRLSIAQKVQSQIRSDSRARIRTQGLLGDRYLDIYPGSAEAPVLQPGDTLLSIDAVELDEVLVDAADALEEGRLVVEDLRRVSSALVRGEGTLGRLLTDEELYVRFSLAANELEGTLRQINRSDGTIGRLIRDPQLYEQFQRAVTRIDSLGTEILRGRGTLGRLVQSDSVYVGLLGAATRADSAFAGLSGIIGRMRQGRGTMEKLFTDPLLYDQFLKALVDLQTLVNDIRANPTRYRPQMNIDIF